MSERRLSNRELWTRIIAGTLSIPVLFFVCVLVPFWGGYFTREDGWEHLSWTALIGLWLGIVLIRVKRSIQAPLKPSEVRAAEVEEYAKKPKASRRDCIGIVVLGILVGVTTLLLLGILRNPF